MSLASGMRLRPYVVEASIGAGGMGEVYRARGHSLWRARIAALLGEKALAVDTLRDALAQGAFFGIEMHRDMDLEPLKDSPEFRELMRPKD